MVSDPNLIHYACVAKGTTVLAESNSNDAALGAIAAKCLHHTPPFHARFTHTVRSRTYAFLIDDAFVYFSISDHKLDKSEGSAFLDRVRSAFAGVWKLRNKSDPHNLNPHCFQGELSPVFRQLLGSGHDHIGGSESEMKNRILSWEKQENEDDDMGNGLIMHRNGELSGHQKAMKSWKRQMWFILLLDFLVCVILFSIWLWVCRGFKCFNS